RSEAYRKAVPDKLACSLINTGIANDTSTAVCTSGGSEILLRAWCSTHKYITTAICPIDLTRLIHLNQACPSKAIPAPIGLERRSVSLKAREQILAISISGIGQRKHVVPGIAEHLGQGTTICI